MLPLLIYRFSLWLYQAGIRMAAAASHAKAKAWLSGRRNWRQNLSAATATWGAAPRIWMHCASLGEFEQGRPVLEALRAQHPDWKILLTFFSPSGYEQAGRFSASDYTGYLPLDGPNAAARFVRTAQPSAVLFVKYEFWYFYLRALHRARIPAILLCGAFRKDQPFFKWYGGMFRKMLGWYRHLLVQDAASLQCLHSKGLGPNASLGGDTRYDRVAALAQQLQPIPVAAQFAQNHPVLVAGSTWPADEALLAAAFSVLPADCRLIIAPHEIALARIAQLEALFPAAVRYSRFQDNQKSRVLIIDNIGLLSRLYRYGQVAYVGGGFAKSGIHNALEPAVYGMPIVFGPHHHKFSEAVALVNEKFATPVTDVESLKAALEEAFRKDEPGRELQRQWMAHHTGATVIAVQATEQALAV